MCENKTDTNVDYPTTETERFGLGTCLPTAGVILTVQDNDTILFFLFSRIPKKIIYETSS